MLRASSVIRRFPRYCIRLSCNSRLLFPGLTWMRGARRIHFPTNTLAHECGRPEMIPATSDLDELFLSPANICSIVGYCYIGHSSPSYKAFNSDNARTGVDRTTFFQVHSSGAETRKQEHPSFLRAVPNENKEGAKVFHTRYWRLAPDSKAFLLISRASCGVTITASRFRQGMH